MTGSGECASVGEIASAVRASQRSAADHLDDALAAMRRADSDGLNAFLSRDPERARRAADDVDAAGVASGRRPGPLAGVPVALKDNICTVGLPTTCGSRVLEGYRSSFEATAVRRLRAAGALVVGKTNLDEFAMGSSTEYSAFGATANPHDPARVPGGSSGGSAAAVAAGIVPAALGSDTAGSVRQPAAFCGVAGLKPTYGRVSRYGLVAFASSLDQIGTFGRTAGDAALVLEAIGGPDPRDSTAGDRPAPDLTHAAEEGADGLVVGVPEEYFPAELSDDVDEQVRAAAGRLEAAGAELRAVSLPHTAHAIPAYHVLAAAEAASNLARFDGVRFGRRAGGADSTRAVYERARSRGFGDEVKRRILLGTHVLSAGDRDDRDARAQRVRLLIARDFRRVFAGGVDVLFAPTTPTVAFRRGALADDPYGYYRADMLTVPANLAGLPAISVPVGTADGLPVGAQFIAPAWDEATLVRAAAVVERT